MSGTKPPTGPDGPLRLQVPDKWFSPNGDGRKDSVSFNVISESAEPYMVEVRKSGSVHTNWGPFVGNQPLSWDGKQDGAALPDGQYNIVVYTVEKRGRIRDNEKVGIDTTPPSIEYKVKANKDDPTSGELEVVFTDKESGIDTSKTQVTNLSTQVKPGIPVIQGESQPAQEKENALQKFFSLLFPTFEPSFQVQGGAFSILSEGDSSTDDIVFGTASSENQAGVPFQVALNSPVLQTNLLGSPCQSSGNKFQMVGVFDFDPAGPDLTIVVSPKTLSTNGRISERDVSRVVSDAYPNASLLHDNGPDRASAIKNAKGNTPGYANKAQEAWNKAVQLFSQGKNTEAQKLVNTQSLWVS